LVNGKVLITGSSGLIGTAVTNRLLALGTACVSVDLRAIDPGHRIDPERARAILGWQASTDLKSGLSRLAQDFL
jgi:nucleoside-diphosphate-sugar epimerase